MNREAFGVFDRIRADEELKKKTAGYLRARIREGGKRSRSGRTGVRGFAAAFSCLAVLLVCGVVSWRLYFAPAAYIDLDINPSVELTVNRLGRVIHAGARNEAGEDILDAADLLKKDYGKAVERLLDAMAAEGYFTKDSLLCITVQAEEQGREQNMLSGLREAVESAESRCRRNIAADVYAVTDEIKHCADENQISPAKYLAIRELLEVEPDADFEECKGQSVRELKRLAKECRDSREHGGTGGNGYPDEPPVESGGEETDDTPDSPENSTGNDGCGVCGGHGGYHHGH